MARFYKSWRILLVQYKEYNVGAGNFFPKLWQPSLQIIGGTGVNVGTFNGINANAFGFYLDPNSNKQDGVWYSLDQLNGGSSQMMAYQNVLMIQHKIHALTKEKKFGGAILCVEHPPVLTLGRHASSRNLLVDGEFLQKKDKKEQKFQN